MNPYSNLPRQNFWNASARAQDALEVDFDSGRKFVFSASDQFATAGSCFAQHFATQLAERGGRVLVAEARHPLVSESSEHGYGLFSARYGNIYTVRQLLELLEQAFGLRETVYDMVARPDGRWVDMLRPRAVPMGFASLEHARADRDYHLHAVRQMVEKLDVFVFTLGLTEVWINVEHGYCYPVVPGSVAGQFIENRHCFHNFSFAETVADLERVIGIVASNNAMARILFTVSPVGLVATAEQRNVMVSTTASKSILRSAVDAVVRSHSSCDYFPSFEIITSPYSRGKYWAEGLRDVNQSGINTVMDVFFRSRLPDFQAAAGDAAALTPAHQAHQEELEAALTEECDEMFLDPELRSRQ